MLHFQKLSDSEALKSHRLIQLEKMLRRKRLRFYALKSRLAILAAIRSRFPEESTDYVRRVSENLLEQATTYGEIASCQGGIRWIQRAIEIIEGSD